MDSGPDISDFSRRDVTLLGKTKPVLLIGGTGPAVIVIHEVYTELPFSLDTRQFYSVDQRCIIRICLRVIERL